VQQNKAEIVDKIQGLDFMMGSLAKIHKDHEKEQAELYKKISTRKLLLMDELFKLLSHLTV
jgi:hypothetical protein